MTPGDVLYRAELGSLLMGPFQPTILSDLVILECSMDVWWERQLLPKSADIAPGVLHTWEFTEANPQVLACAFSSFLLYYFWGVGSISSFDIPYPTDKEDSVVKKHSASLVTYMMIKLI